MLPPRLFLKGTLSVTLKSIIPLLQSKAKDCLHQAYEDSLTPSFHGSKAIGMLSLGIATDAAAIEDWMKEDLSPSAQHLPFIPNDAVFSEASIDLADSFAATR
jgi:hypothetical protein